MVTREDLERAKDEADQAYAAHKAAAQRFDNLHTQWASETFGVKLDDMVTDKRGRKGLVCKIKPWSSGKPWVTAKEIKKDGSIGMRELQMYSDWTVLAE
jgi:hypothetical protein